MVTTGGADAKLTLWRDATAEAAAEEATATATLIRSEQALSNALQRGQLTKALALALGLGRPGAMYKAVTALLSSEGGDEALHG